MEIDLLQFSPLYGFVRSRQLEGTFPGEQGMGVSGSTPLRVKRGWGRILESEWPYAKNTAIWPPTEPPGLDAKAKQHRIFSYQRIRNSFECRKSIDFHKYVIVSFGITDQWQEPYDGRIEMPAAGDRIVAYHAVQIFHYDDSSKHFVFVNSWGKDWGHDGCGYLSYEFFDEQFQEAFVANDTAQLNIYSLDSNIHLIPWYKRDFLGRSFYAREFFDADADERIGWAFALQADDHLAVEELYIRPQFRRQGYGTKLLQSLLELSNKLELPLQFFIPFADLDQDNLCIVERLLSKGGYYLSQSDLHWCSCTASSDAKASASTFPMTLPSPRPLPLGSKPSGW
jgi:GNAT superfamily N-acetyltransferase